MCKRDDEEERLTGQREREWSQSRQQGRERRGEERRQKHTGDTRRQLKETLERKKERKKGSIPQAAREKVAEVVAAAII